MAVRHLAVGAVLYLLQRNVEPAGRADRAFEPEQLPEPHREMRRSGGVLVVFDVDDFKQINDRYGHLQGDVCLAEIADCIKKAYARCGSCYRIGGDEFCVLLKDEESEARCAKTLQALLAERRKVFAILPTVFLGSAAFSGEDVVAVKDRADRALYCAKKEQKARAAAEKHGDDSERTV